VSPWADRFFDAPRLLTGLMLLATLVGLLCFGVIAWRVIETATIAERNSKRIEQAEFRTCRRVQVLRDTVNRNSETIFLTLDAAARNPTVPARIRAAYRDYTSRVVHLPRTNCTRAVRQDGYLPPPPVPMRTFLRQHP
jgi:hypothetical protein